MACVHLSCDGAESEFVAAFMRMSFHWLACIETKSVWSSPVDSKKDETVDIPTNQSGVKCCRVRPIRCRHFSFKLRSVHPLNDAGICPKIGIWPWQPWTI
eukprot:scaffold2563_cov124-Cylindrotheca_fusiformis.AAC.26